MLILCPSHSITSVLHRSMPIPGKATGSINTLSTPLLMLLGCAISSWIQFDSSQACAKGGGAGGARAPPDF